MREKSIFSLQSATLEDLDELIQLEKYVEQCLPSRDIFATDERPFYETILRGQGHILTARDTHGAMAGASIIRFPSPDDPEHLGHSLGLSRSEMLQVRHLESIFIRPDCQGRKLADMLLRENMRLTEDSGRNLSMATVWPGNIASLKLHMHHGLFICAFALKYGGKPRFILAGGPQPPQLEKHAEAIPITDLGSQQKKLAQGYLGVDVQEKSINYARGRLPFVSPSSPRTRDVKRV